MNYLSYIHFFCVISYLYMIAFVLLQNPRSLLSRVCAAMFFSFAIWSFSFIPIHNHFTQLPIAKVFLNISSIGLFNFCNFFFWFVIIFTEKSNFLKSKTLFAGIFGISLILLIAQWQNNAVMVINEAKKFSYGWDTFLQNSPWSAVHLIQSYSLAIAGLCILFVFRKKNKGSIKGKQAYIIIITVLHLVVVNSIIVTISEWNRAAVPFMGDVIYLIWSGGILYTITKYQLFSLTPSTAAKELLETMSDTVLLVDTKGLIKSINSSSLNLFKCKRKEIINQPFEAFFNNGQIGGEPFKDIIQREAFHNLETRCITKNGKETPVLFSSSLMRDSDNAVLGVVCVIRDMTEQRRLEKEVIEVEGREQLRIGHDLHDGLGQHLTGVSLGCKALEGKASSGSGIKAEDVAEITALILQATETVRHLSRGLSPVEMQNGGLVLALQELAKRTESMFSISCIISADESIHWNNEVVATHLYRIAQEAITNAVKHGNADKIDIFFTLENEKIILKIMDNGSGIPDTSERKKGMGLRIMNYRARIIGAAIDVFRRDEGGTVVSCTIPREEAVGSES